MEIPIFIFWLTLSFAVAFIAQSRKIGFWGGLLCALLLSPLIGFLIVIFSEKKSEGEKELLKEQNKLLKEFINKSNGGLKERSKSLSLNDSEVMDEFLKNLSKK